MFDAEILTKINAEAYLGILYPELASQWAVYDKGLFYRNYSGDILALDADNAAVTLSRDGWLRYFPQEMISPEDEIVGSEQGKNRAYDPSSLDKAIKKRIGLLQESFVPFDSFRFRTNMKLEKKIQEILSLKMDFILKEYFGFDMESETDGYVRKAALLLPFITKIRGNISFVKSLLQTLTGHRVSMHSSIYSDSDDTMCAMRKVCYNLIINDLTARTYKQEMMKIKPLTDFIRERFIPLEMLCEFGIKGSGSGDTLLDYNYYI